MLEIMISENSFLFEGFEELEV